MYYIFQESKIWEAGDPIDESRKPVTIRAKTKEAARKKLKRPGSGRVWVFVRTKS